MDKFFILLQYLTPQHLLSRLVGVIANCRWNWLKNIFINWFINHYQVDMSLAEHIDPKEYQSFNDFFIRKLKPEARPLPSDPSVIISPIDGTISQLGDIKGDSIFQAKGHYYNLEKLLGQKKYTDKFFDGKFITLYLSPKDYHRVHMPLTGMLQEMTYVPGKLFSVNPLSTQTIPGLFARNERVVSVFNTEIGPVAIIMVGAMIVASINTIWAGKITPNSSGSIQTWQYSTQKETIKLEQGAEMGYFNLGSTVIVLLPPNSINWETHIKNNAQLIMGETIAHFN